MHVDSRIAGLAREELRSRFTVEFPKPMSVLLTISVVCTVSRIDSDCALDELSRSGAAASDSVVMTPPVWGCETLS